MGHGTLIKWLNRFRNHYPHGGHLFDPQCYTTNSKSCHHRMLMQHLCYIQIDFVKTVQSNATIRWGIQVSHAKGSCDNISCTCNKASNDLVRKVCEDEHPRYANGHQKQKRWAPGKGSCHPPAAKYREFAWDAHTRGSYTSVTLSIGMEISFPLELSQPLLFKYRNGGKKQSWKCHSSCHSKECSCCKLRH